MREHRGYFRAIQKELQLKLVNWSRVDACYSLNYWFIMYCINWSWNLDSYGDFKIDHTQLMVFQDIYRDIHIMEEEGVLVCTSDSTNSHAPGFTRTEKTVVYIWISFPKCKRKSYYVYILFKYSQSCTSNWKKRLTMEEKYVLLEINGKKSWDCNESWLY